MQSCSMKNHIFLKLFEMISANINKIWMNSPHEKCMLKDTRKNCKLKKAPSHLTSIAWSVSIYKHFNFWGQMYKKLS